MVIEGFGVQGPYQRHLVCVLSQPRQQIGQLHAALATRSKSPPTREQCGGFLDEGKADIFCDRIGQLLPVAGEQLRFGIEQVELAGSSRSVDKDAVPRPGTEVGWPGSQRVGWRGLERNGAAGKRSVGTEQACNRRGSEPARRGGEEGAPGGERKRRPDSERVLSAD